MSQLVFSVRWDPEGIGSNDSEGIDLVARASRQRELPSSLSLYRLPAGDVARIKRGSSHFK